jgi:hypothetical protein
MADEREERIRRKAHEIWEQERKPPGREAEHWDMARELVAIEANQELATEPVEHVRQAVAGQRHGEPVEALGNTGEFPTLRSGRAADSAARSGRKRLALPAAEDRSTGSRMMMSSCAKAVAPIRPPKVAASVPP